MVAAFLSVHILDETLRSWYGGVNHEGGREDETVWKWVINPVLSSVQQHLGARVVQATYPLVTRDTERNRGSQR